MLILWGTTCGLNIVSTSLDVASMDATSSLDVPSLDEMSRPKVVLYEHNVQAKSLSHKIY